MIFLVDRQLNVSRDVHLQIEKKMFPEIFLSLSIVFKTFCSLRRVLPSKSGVASTRASYFFSFSFSFLSKAERAWPRLLAFSRRCCRAPFSRPGQRVHSDSACFGATAYFSESRECVPA